MTRKTGAPDLGKAPPQAAMPPISGECSGLAGTRSVVRCQTLEVSIRNPICTVAAALVVVVFFVSWTPDARAQAVSDATRLGAFSGAMRYCEERFGGSERRYRIARLRAAGAIDGMSSRDKLRAIGARDRAYEGGQFLGNSLDARECRALLKMSEWKAFVD